MRSTSSVEHIFVLAHGTRIGATCPAKVLAMDLDTVGRVFYPRYRMLLWHTASEAFSPELGKGIRFRLVWAERGTGIVRFGEHRQTFIAPVLFCLNETEAPQLEQAADVQAQALYFHPTVINSAFTFENVRRPPADLMTTAVQDLHWLRPFVERHAAYRGQLPVGPALAQRLSGLYQALERELDLQRDSFWPCRSRSLLLEILFMVGHVFSMPQEPGALQANRAVSLPGAADDMDPVILYLHTHYQDKVTIGQLSRMFHTNRTTLAERFRQATDMSVISYLTRLRVRLAALMLRDTRLPVSEVMARVGFVDSTHFGRTFRKHAGCTPSQYRERYCWVP
jgi:AraC-like DNA-binding protein